MSNAIRRPRSFSGTGVGSSGMGLSYAPARVLDDLADLAHRPLDVVVHHDVAVLLGVGHLAFADLAARGEVLRRFASPLLLAMLELLFRRRDHEDEHRVRHQPADLLSALDVNLQHHVTALVTRLLDQVAEGAVEVAVVGRVLEERALRDQRLELLACEERVVLVRSRPRLPRRPGHRIDEVRVELEQAPDQRVLPHPRRPGNHDQQAALQASDSQNTVKSSGVGASNVISAPERGWRSRSREAWSIGRPRLCSWPPYSVSPAIG